jgi:DNA-binding CsgD family transcriptional regulator
MAPRKSPDDRPLGGKDSRSQAEISRLARQTADGMIPNAVRTLRRGVSQIGASTFAMFYTGRGAGSARLVHCFDEQFPRMSRVSTVIAETGSEALARHAATSALPVLWLPVGAGSALSSLFLSTLPVAIPGSPGIAFPVSAESGRTGLFVFTGDNIHGDKDAILALHKLCYEIFAAVSDLKSGTASSAATISKRELECLKLTAAGRTSDDIARILKLSVHTANQYLTSVSGKLDAVNRMQAVAKAIRQGLID